MGASDESSLERRETGGGFDCNRVPEFSQRQEVIPDDMVKVRGLVRATGFFSEDEVAIAAELVQERLRLGLAGGYHFLFWERAAKLAAYTCYGPIGGTRSSYDLFWIAVAPEFQGRGIGRHLLKRTEQLIWKQGGGIIYVETSSRSLYKPTRRFYLRMGYRIEAVLKGFYGPRDHKCILSKTRPLVADGMVSRRHCDAVS